MYNTIYSVSVKLKAGRNVVVGLQRREKHVGEPYDEEHDSADDFWNDRAAKFGAAKRWDVSTCEEDEDAADSSDAKQHHAETQRARVDLERLALDINSVFFRILNLSLIHI